MSKPADPSEKKRHDAQETVKLDASALRKLVVSTVVTVDDEDEEPEAEGRKQPRADDPPRTP